MLGFLVAWLVNSTIVAVIAGFQSGHMSLGQWVVAGGGGLVLGYLEVRLLEALLPGRKPIIEPPDRRTSGHAGIGFVSERSAESS